MDFVDRNPAAATALAELEAQPALADSRVTDHADDLPVPLARAREDAVEPGELRFPPDQTGEAPEPRRVEPRAEGAGLPELEDPDGSAHALHRPRAEVGESEEPLDQPSGVLGEKHCSGGGQLLHP